MSLKFSYIEERSVCAALEKDPIWKCACSEWEYTTFIDTVITKIRRAMRMYDFIRTLLPKEVAEEEKQKIQDFEDSLIYALLYTRELKRRLK